MEGGTLNEGLEYKCKALLNQPTRRQEVKRKLTISLFSLPLVLSISIHVLAMFILVMSTTPVAAENPPLADKPYPIIVGVGQAVSICTTGTIVCPARSPICDDTSVATVRDGESGLEIVGVNPGTTLCAVTSATAFRTIYSVTVR